MYKRRAGECRGLARDILNDPIEYVRLEMVILFCNRCPLSHAFMTGCWDDTTVPRQGSVGQVCNQGRHRHR